MYANDHESPELFPLQNSPEFFVEVDFLDDHAVILMRTHRCTSEFGELQENLQRCTAEKLRPSPEQQLSS